MLRYNRLREESFLRRTVKMDSIYTPNRRGVAVWSANEQIGFAGESVSIKSEPTQFHLRHIPELDGLRGLSIHLVFLADPAAIVDSCEDKTDAR